DDPALADLRRAGATLGGRRALARGAGALGLLLLAAAAARGRLRRADLGALFGRGAAAAATAGARRDLALLGGRRRSGGRGGGGGLLGHRLLRGGLLGHRLLRGRLLRGGLLGGGRRLLRLLVCRLWGLFSHVSSGLRCGRCRAGGRRSARVRDRAWRSRRRPCSPARPSPAGTEARTRPCVRS